MKVLMASYIILGISRLAQIIMPILYTPRHNNKLMDALNYDKIAFNIMPSFDNKGNTQIALAVSHKY
jgi:hypothetical protein